MKKLLLLGLILAICILAMPQGVLADTATVNANVVQFTDFTASGDVSGWNLYYGNPGPVNTQTDGLTLNVIANNPWHVTVLGTNGGKMMPFGSGGYTGTALTNALNIDTQQVTGSAVDLASGGRTSSWSQSYDYVQTLEATDQPRTDYQIVLTLDFATQA
jgi:hypothetical protein